MSDSRWAVNRRANVLAGLTVTAYLVPQVMAYATVAGLPPAVGLWAALPALVIYAVMGTSRLLSVGPESSVALITAAVVAPLAMGDPSRYPALAAALALAVAAVLLAASLARLGFVADLLSRPVLTGYLAGIAILMIMGQLGALLGIRISGDSVIEQLVSVSRTVDQIEWAEVLIGLTVIALVLVLSRWPRVPGPLVAIGVVGAFTWLADSAAARVGPIPSGLPAPALPGIPASDIAPLLVGAVGVSVVAFTDSTLTARAFRSRHDPELRPGAELRALAVANAGSGFLQGMPVSSSGSRTALAKEGQATSQAYSLVAAAGLVVVLLVAGPVLSELPRAALSGLVVYAAIRLINFKELGWLWRFRRSEFLLAAFTFFGVLLLGVLYGVLAAIAVSMLELLSRVARPHSAPLGVVPGLAGMHDVEDFAHVREEPGLLVFRYDSPLFFANAENFRHRALTATRERTPGLRWFALNCEAIVEIDSTAVAALDELRRDLAQQGIQLVLVRAKRELIEALAPTGFLDRIGREHNYPTLPTLVAAFRGEPPPPYLGEPTNGD